VPDRLNQLTIRLLYGPVELSWDSPTPRRRDAVALGHLGRLSVPSPVGVSAPVELRIPEKVLLIGAKDCLETLSNQLQLNTNRERVIGHCPCAEPVGSHRAELLFPAGLRSSAVPWQVAGRSPARIFAAKGDS
jgi:hypothetical protein